VWHHPEGTANILSSAQVKKHFKVSFDDDCFTVEKNNGTTRQFVESEQGLHCLDMSKQKKSADIDIGAALVTTAADKKSDCTVKICKNAELAHRIQNTTGHPSLRDFLRTVEKNQLVNCPVSRPDMVAADDLFGPNLGSLRGKTVRRNAAITTTNEAMIPSMIKDQCQVVTMGIDIMFVNKIAFLVTMSESIEFGTVEHIENRQHETILEAVCTVKRLCSMRGFDLCFCKADSEFDSLREELSTMDIDLKAASEDEHVPEVERFIRTVKERTRATCNALPFKQMPARMITEMVKSSVMWLNVFPASDGVSTTLSPRTTVTGKTPDHNQHCRIEFGACAQTHEEHDNLMRPRTIGATALRPTGNSDNRTISPVIQSTSQSRVPSSGPRTDVRSKGKDARSNQEHKVERKQ